MIEMFVVTQVLSIFEIFKDQVGQFLVVTFFTFLVMIYVYLGGFKSVIDTDKLQLILMYSASCILLVIGFVLFSQEGYKWNPSILSMSPLSLLEGEWYVSIAFLSFFFAINFYRYISYIGSWQRILAVGRTRRITKGLKQNIYGVVILVSILITVGVLFAGSESKLGEYDATVMVSYLQWIQDLGGTTGPILLGLVISGFLAALISTADSHIVACLQTSTFDTLKLFGADYSDIDIVWISRNVALPITLVISLCLYFFLVFKSGWGFSDLLFLFFSHQAVLSIPILYVMFRRDSSSAPVNISLIVGIAIYWFVSSKYSNVDSLTYSNPMIIILAELAIITITHYLMNK